MWSDFPRGAQSMNCHRSGLDVQPWLSLFSQHQLGVQLSGPGQLLSVLQSHDLHIAGTEHLPTLRGHSAQEVSVLKEAVGLVSTSILQPGKGATGNEYVGK